MVDISPFFLSFFFGNVFQGSRLSKRGKAVLVQSQTSAAELGEVAADGQVVYVGFMPAIFPHLAL